MFLRTLFERNPDADPEELKAALFSEAENNPALEKAIVQDWARQALPLLKKEMNGEKLTAEEQVTLDTLAPPGSPIAKSLR